jgi:SAM-dependent methyltransferase
LFEWWLGEVAGDPAYEEVVTPMLFEVFSPEPGLRYLDVGCGEGRVMRVVGGMGAAVIGLDLSYELVSHAGSGVVADLIAMPLRDDSFDGVYSVLTLEHVEDHEAFFSEAARVTKPGGVLALVINHPTWTAPGSTPISDSDGEVLWRPGDYFSEGRSEVPAGGGSVAFHHRNMANLLSSAAESGWGLEKVCERPHHEFKDQAGIPRLLACRWRSPS